MKVKYKHVVLCPEVFRLTNENQRETLEGLFLLLGHREVNFYDSEDGALITQYSRVAEESKVAKGNDLVVAYIHYLDQLFEKAERGHRLKDLTVSNPTASGYELVERILEHAWKVLKLKVVLISQSLNYYAQVNWIVADGRLRIVAHVALWLSAPSVTRIRTGRVKGDVGKNIKKH